MLAIFAFFQPITTQIGVLIYPPQKVWNTPTARERHGPGSSTCGAIMSISLSCRSHAKSMLLEVTVTKKIPTF